MKAKNKQFDIKKLSLIETSNFFKENGEDYFEKLSDRVDINEYSENLIKNSIQFSLWDNKTLIGLSPCYFNNSKESVAYISSLTIKKGFRGKKLGSQMIQQINHYAQKRNFNTVMVKIHYDNLISHNFYMKNGFKGFIEDEVNNFRLMRLEVN